MGSLSSDLITLADENPKKDTRSRALPPLPPNSSRMSMARANRARFQCHRQSSEKYVRLKLGLKLFWLFLFDQKLLQTYLFINCLNYIFAKLLCSPTNRQDLVFSALYKHVYIRLIAKKCYFYFINHQLSK